MTFKKTMPLWRGLAAVFLALLIIGTMGYSIADRWRSSVDAALGTTSYETIEGDDGYFVSAYDTHKEMWEAARAHSVKQGREGFVLMKNDNNALPLSAPSDSVEIALFGTAAWAPYMQSSGDLKAGNADAVNLDDALSGAGYTLNSTMKNVYSNLLANYTVSSRYGNTTITYSNGYVTSPGDLADYQVRECPPDRYTDQSLLTTANNPDNHEWVDVSNWESELESANASKELIGICVFARGAGESNTYKPGAGTTDFAGNATDKDPLRLSDDELAVIDTAKEHCDKVIVLLNSGNTMEIGDITEGGAHEVDAIGYMGVINDYQCEGIVEVLMGKYNATGALSDTYVQYNLSAPAMMNFGGDEYLNIAEANSDVGEDPRWPDVAISASASGGGGFSGGSYSGGEYIVEAEGIYVGYQYYETRYYDSVADDNTLVSGASSNKGASDGNGWSYSEEVIYPFGHGLSYLKYKQEIKSVSVDLSENGNVTATIDVTNESDKDGYFLTQLYVNQPYTKYDVDNKVEKSAVTFLNSKKVEVKAGDTETIEITVPSKYLASYDYTNAKTYILDEGDYLFTAAAGAHAAANNFLAHEGYAVADGMTAAGTGEVVTWNLGSFDDTTFATDNGYEVTNVADDADLNYRLPDSVTYLSRSDWDATYPVNYNEGDNVADINESDKKEEWIKQIQGRNYEIDNTGKEAEYVDGRDTGVKFGTEFITEDIRADINDPFWDILVSGISVNEAIGAVIHGGGQSDTLTNVDNPIVGQNEGVNGIKGDAVDENDDSVIYHYNINSQTLMGTSFNPDLAYEWGVLQGNAGLHLQKYAVWGTGLTLRRTPYNGRNYEYISEDPMLTNRIGYGILKGTADMGLVCGPKHIGFNDQEHNRDGIAVYMNEQKFRQTDLRGFQGGLDEGGGLAVMVAFNRIGATNASHHVGMLKHILREEWGFTGVISTDLANNARYFNAESMIMATVTQRAEFGGDNSYISKTNDHSEFDGTYTYISVDTVKNDATLVEQARENLKYQLYTFANSAVLNIRTVAVVPWWEALLIAAIVIFSVLAAASAVLWIVTTLLPKKEVN